MAEIIIFLTVSILQVFIALGLVNVWLVRFNNPTQYRGAGAKNMKEEFAVYGLPGWSVYVVGFLKIAIAMSMIFVLFVPFLMMKLGIPAAIALSVLMLGAISMHIKVKDSLKQTAPAIGMLLMALTIIILVLVS